MKTARKLNRRSFFLQVAGGAIGAGALGLIGGEARAQTGPYTGVTDNDSGSYADNAGHGRGPGGNASGHPQTQTGITDRDPSDPSGGGRGTYTGYSDSDSGGNADPSGGGRHGNNPPSRPSNDARMARRRPDGSCVIPTGQTDADSGQTRDPAGYGSNGGQFQNVVGNHLCYD